MWTNFQAIQTSELKTWWFDRRACRAWRRLMTIQLWASCVLYFMSIRHSGNGLVLAWENKSNAAKPNDMQSKSNQKNTISANDNILVWVQQLAAGAPACSWNKTSLSEISYYLVPSPANSQVGFILFIYCLV